MAHALWRTFCVARFMAHALRGHALWRTLCGARSVAYAFEAHALWPRPVAFTLCPERFGHVAVLPVFAESVLQLSADGDRVAVPVR